MPTESKNGEIYVKMGLILRDIGAVKKAQTNSSQGWKFRSIDDMYNEVHEAMSKHGVFCLPIIKSIIYREKIKSARGQEGWHQILEIEYRFVAADGSHVSCVVWGEGSEFGGDKLTNKCLSIAHKYALIQTFLIPTADMEDPDKTSPLHDDNKLREQKYREQQQKRPDDHKTHVALNVEMQKRLDNQPMKVAADSQDEKLAKMKAEMIRLVSTTNIDWKTVAKMPKETILDKVKKENSFDNLKNMWSHLQKWILPDLPEKP